MNFDNVAPEQTEQAFARKTPISVRKAPQAQSRFRVS